MAKVKEKRSLEVDKTINKVDKIQKPTTFAVFLLKFQLYLSTETSSSAYKLGLQPY